MSANLTIRSNGFTEFAQIEGNPIAWHGKGNFFRKGAPLQEITDAAGMGWDIQRGKVRFATDRAGTLSEFPGQLVLMRSDNKYPLGIVSDKYKTHNPREIIGTINETARAAGYHIETLGTLFGGKELWVLASNGESAEVGKGDVVLNRALIHTATDGSAKTSGRKTSVCVVCSNTLAMAMAESKAASAQSHRSKYDADAMRRALGMQEDETFGSFMQDAYRMADKAVSRQRAEDLLFRLMAPADVLKNPDADSITKVMESRGFGMIMELFEGKGMGSTLDGRKGTAWGWLNAVTEYADHHIRATSDENRIASAWFGTGDALKVKARDLAVAFSK